MKEAISNFKKRWSKEFEIHLDLNTYEDIKKYTFMIIHNEQKKYIGCKFALVTKCGKLIHKGNLEFLVSKCILYGIIKTTVEFCKLNFSNLEKEVVKNKYVTNIELYLTNLT